MPERDGAIMPEIARALDDMSHDLQLFQLYNQLLQSAVESPDIATEALLDFLQFWVGVIYFLREHRQGQCHVT